MTKKTTILVLVVCSAVAVLYAVNMAYFSTKPDFFSVSAAQDTARGTLFADTCRKLMEHELSGPGGWMPNDIFPSPTVLLDNRPNFQLGVLETVRYSSRVLRDNLSRQRTSDKIDADCDKAFTAFSNDPYRWIMPSAEGKYSAGVAALGHYSERLGFGTASFYPRSDNLIQLLEQYVSLLGGVNTRLLNASRRHLQDGAGAARVAWTEIDDNFYYAQGIGFALYHLLQAVRVEFQDVLRDKNAGEILDEVIASLGEAYFEPLVVTNGSKNGVFANHSSNLRVFLDDARQKSNSLVTILDQG